MKSKFVFLVASALVLSGCSASQEFAEDGSCDGVEVVVNYSDLAETTKQCIGLDGNSELAKNVLASAGIAIEGTKAYGDQVICRVNNIPAADKEILVEGEEPYIETCEEMPAAFAYWGLWVRDSQSAEWEYAMEGISSLQLSRGQSIGLAFSLAGEAPNPDQ